MDGVNENRENKSVCYVFAGSFFVVGRQSGILEYCETTIIYNY